LGAPFGQSGEIPSEQQRKPAPFESHKGCGTRAPGKSEVKDPKCKTGTWGTQIQFDDQYVGHSSSARYSIQIKEKVSSVLGIPGICPQGMHPRYDLRCCEYPTE